MANGSFWGRTVQHKRGVARNQPVTVKTKWGLFVIQAVFLQREDMERLQNKHRYKDTDELTGEPCWKSHNEALLAEFLTDTVKGWSGLTPDVLSELLGAEITLRDLEQDFGPGVTEMPWSAENVAKLGNNSVAFGDFVQTTTLKPANYIRFLRQKEFENLGNSPSDGRSETPTSDSPSAESA